MSRYSSMQGESSSCRLGSRTKVMIDRDSWGHSYSTVRGGILGFVKDELLRKHVPMMFSLIKNESEGSKTIRYCPGLNHKP